MEKEILLKKVKVGEKLNEIKTKCRVIRETADEIVVEAGSCSPELMEIYEGLERMDE